MAARTEDVDLIKEIAIEARGLCEDLTGRVQKLEKLEMEEKAKVLKEELDVVKLEVDAVTKVMQCVEELEKIIKEKAKDDGKEELVKIRKSY